MRSIRVNNTVYSTSTLVNSGGQSIGVGTVCNKNLCGFQYVLYLMKVTWKWAPARIQNHLAQRQSHFIVVMKEVMKNRAAYNDMTYTQQIAPETTILPS